MLRLPVVVFCFVVALVLTQATAPAQDKAAGISALQRELDLLKRENDLLKRENDLLKQELAALKKGGGAKATESDADASISTISENVEYVYQGITRNGANLMVTLLATSKKGDQSGPNGEMTLVDPDGDKYLGQPVGGFGVRPLLREGVPTRLTWRFGPNIISGKSSAPSATISRFTLLSVATTVGGGGNSIEFRNVPAMVPKSKAK